MRVLLVVLSGATGFIKYPDEILSIAGVLEKGSHKVRVYDANMDDRKPEDFLSFRPDLVGFAVATGPNITDAIARSIEFKRAFPGIKVVWGFRHPSALPEETMAQPCIDYVIKGTGEYTLLELLNYLETGNPAINEIKGLVHRKKGMVIINEPRPFLKDMDKLPDPAWHFTDVKKY